MNLNKLYLRWIPRMLFALSFSGGTLQLIAQEGSNLPEFSFPVRLASEPEPYSFSTLAGLPARLRRNPT